MTDFKRDEILLLTLRIFKDFAKVLLSLLGVEEMTKDQVESLLQMDRGDHGQEWLRKIVDYVLHPTSESDDES